MLRPEPALLFHRCLLEPGIAADDFAVQQNAHCAIHQGCFDNDAIIKQSGFIVEKISSVSDSAVGVDGQRDRA